MKRNQMRLLNGDATLTLAEVLALVMLGKATRTFGAGGEEIYTAQPVEDHDEAH